MFHRLLSLTAAALLLGTAAISAERAMSFHDLQSKRLNGQPANLSEYKGKVVLVVNTASACGTPLHPARGT